MITIRAKPEEIVWPLTPRGVEAINTNFDQLYQDALRVATVLGIDDSGVAHLTLVATITATLGTIGGWTIGATSLTAGAGANTVGLDSGGTNPAFYAGSATPGSAPFRVTQAGVLTSTSGTVGGFTISATELYAGSGVTRVEMQAAGGFWAGADAFASAPFRVSPAGALTATTATITGTVNATAGYFGDGATRVAIEAAGINVGATGSIRGGMTAYNTGTGY
jgi:hypothetical protein